MARLAADPQQFARANILRREGALHERLGADSTLDDRAIHRRRDGMVERVHIGRDESPERESLDRGMVHRTRYGQGNGLRIPGTGERSP